MIADLLARVLADPDDRATRLVYADVIASTDPARGELIVVEDRLLDQPPSPARDALLQRRAALLSEHSLRWWRADETSLETVGGFVRGLHLEPLVQEERLFQIVDHEPVTRLCVSLDPEVPTVEQLAQMRDVELNGLMDPPKLAQWFAALPPQLDSFAIRAPFALEPDPIAFVDGMPRARRLLFDGCRDYVGALLEHGTGWEQLEELGLTGAAILGGEMTELMRRDLSSLRTLRLRGAELDTRGLLALAAAIPRMPALESLDLADMTLRGADPQLLEAVVDACGPRVVVTRALLPTPARVAFMLYNRHWEIRRVDDAREDYSIVIDGHAMTADVTIPLAPLVHALANGSPITLSTDWESWRALPGVRAAKGLHYWLRFDRGVLDIRTSQSPPPHDR